MKAEDEQGAIQALVLAAEDVMDRAFDDRRDRRDRLDRGRLSKSQMSQLIGVCQEARCHEEVVNYLRYQAGRSDPSWTLELTDAVVAGITQVLAAREVGDDDHSTRLAWWRQYATFLARSFTYLDAVRRREGK